MLPEARLTHQPSFEALVSFVQAHPRLCVLTGAGCSTDSGIPAYRDENGAWQHKRPIDYRDFVRSERVRQRYWARSMVGWQDFARARPNLAHRSLVRLERAGAVHHLVTQNVDGLHQAAGSSRVIDLHGRLDGAACLSCGHERHRGDVQHQLQVENPGFRSLTAWRTPDGDAELEEADLSQFHIPSCTECGGVLKPRVVFFGESIPQHRVRQALACVYQADALLVVGSSLMVYSGYRLCCAAAERQNPIAAVNIGRTRADDKLVIKVADRCGAVLAALAERLGA